VSLSALRANFRALQQFVGANVKVCAVVKADAYGHGAERCAVALEAEGARWFGVTTTDEGVPLRDAGLRGCILLMTGFWHGEAEEVVRQKLTATVWEPWHVAALNQAAEDLDVPPQPVHLKVDTGMGRLGVPLRDLPAMCAAIKSARRVALEGFFTHFASSEVLDAADVLEQIARFQEALAIVRAEGLAPSICHMDNTGGMVARPDTHRDMVRPGLALYGYTLPLMRGGAEVPAQAVPSLQPVLSWKTRVLTIKSIPAGQRLGYGGTFTTRVASRIAVLPVGYADGYSRELSNRGRVIVCGRYAPIVGAISMDLTLVDVTEILDAQPGHEVLLIGESGACSITAPEVARHSRTIPYEVLCGISKRVPRNFME
jgi:alanine racemase